MDSSAVASGIVTGQIQIGTAALMSVLGIAVVFLVLAFLAFFMFLLGKIVGGITNKAKKKKEVPAAPEKPAESERTPIVLENVSEKDAALIMAIVADNSGIPLENLDFKSIKLIEG